jgi:ABC-type transporter Mla maintaining outer membrane lipid asymmetry ATPase subunit MlaF
MIAPASSEEQPVVELRDVRLAFGEKEILTGVNLAARKRERLVILGQSGGGKSTLLRLILGILNPPAARCVSMVLRSRI